MLIPGCTTPQCAFLLYPEEYTSQARRTEALSIHLGKYKSGVLLVLLAVGALLVHGYHPYVEDAEIYLPGIEHILKPSLFPTGQEFFRLHAGMTLFPNLVAYSLRITHVNFEVGLLVWQFASVFLLLLSCWKLSGLLFGNKRAQWGSACLIAALLTTPVAGTALYIMDQYLNPRNLAAFAAIFAVAAILERKYLRALLWIAFAGCVHPLMWVFPFSFGLLWIVLEQIERRTKWRIAEPETSGAAMLLRIPLSPTSPAYHESARMHSYFYIQDWEWYEWLGLFAPIALLWWFGNVARTKKRMLLARACRVFALYGIIYFFVALAVDLPPALESLARIQPLRSLHLLYVFLFICIGAFLGEYVLKNRVWRWLVLFVPLSVGMFAAQRVLFSSSGHIEWPGRTPRNAWAQAFTWIRANTPTDAIFALDPEYMRLPGEDEIGFRCLAQRSRLADVVKDGGVVSMFPPLADEWQAQVRAQSPWKDLQVSDFVRLRQSYGASWIVTQQPGIAGLDCPYTNSAVRVCRLP